MFGNIPASERRGVRGDGERYSRGEEVEGGEGGRQRISCTERNHPSPKHPTSCEPKKDFQHRQQASMIAVAAANKKTIATVNWTDRRTLGSQAAPFNGDENLQSPSLPNPGFPFPTTHTERK
ncbi:hypothetical protein ABW19_dt0207165 [Dactylella cylindrospora]|nr:hypothetical protein ABW19_dt0207165 [Dactylella cylindrospora]